MVRIIDVTDELPYFIDYVLTFESTYRSHSLIVYVVDTASEYDSPPRRVTANMILKNPCQNIEVDIL